MSLRRNWIIPSDDDINSSDSPSARVKRGKRGGTMIGFSVNFIWTDGISSLSAPLLPGERIYFCRVDTRDTACCSTRFPHRSPPVIADLLCRIACIPRCSLSLSRDIRDFADLSTVIFPLWRAPFYIFRLESEARGEIDRILFVFKRKKSV